MALDLSTIEEAKIYINKIQIEQLKDFTERAITEFGSLVKLKKANKVADIVWQKFEYLGYITEQAQQQFVDITIAACLLHNLFYNEADITTLLKHRVKLADIATELDIDIRLINLVYEIIESQLGENHPVSKLKPTVNSPSYTFAESVWQVNNYRSRV